MNVIYDFLRSDGSVVVNKKLIHAIGLHEAIIFSELISKYNYFEMTGIIINEFWTIGKYLWVDHSFECLTFNLLLIISWLNCT